MNRNKDKLSAKAQLLVAIIAICLLLAGCIAQPNMITAQVTQVIDGDTIAIEGGEHIRYIGIDTPEKGQRYYMEAWQANRELVEEKEVQLERDTSERDKYGRLLRYVYVDGVFVNAELVSLGYAEAKSYPPDIKHQSYLEELERKAKKEGKGMWGR